MAGLIPAIHVFETMGKKDVDARDKRGHDERGKFSPALLPFGGLGHRRRERAANRATAGRRRS